MFKTDYEDEIKSIHQNNPHGWFLKIQKNKDFAHLKNYILQKTEFLNCVDFKFSFVTRIWYVLNHLTSIHKCPNCGKEVFRNVETLQNKETRTIERFCCSHKCSTQTEGCKNARIQHCRQKYGCDHVTQTEQHKKSAIQGCLRKYGVPFYAKTEEWKERCLEDCKKRLASEEMKQLRKSALENMTEDDVRKAREKARVSKRKRFYDLYSNNNGVVMITPFEQYLNMNTKKDVFEWRCNQCGTCFNSKINSSWVTNKAYSRHNKFKSYARCPKCYPYDKDYSQEELDLKMQIENICKKYGYTVFHQCDINRQLIYPYEIDVYIPQVRLGIEFNGIFWHSEECYSKFSPRRKDLMFGIRRKSDMCDKIGISLVHIYEDEWLKERVGVLKHLEDIISGNLRISKDTFPQVLDRDKFPSPIVSEKYDIIEKSPPIKKISTLGRQKFTLYTSGTITIKQKEM